MIATTRRTLLMGAACLVAGCQTERRAIVAALPAFPPELEARYASFQDDGHLVEGLDLTGVDPAVLRRRVPDPTGEAPGTVVVDTASRRLYLVEEGGTALRYGIGVGREGLAWAGRATVGRKAEWPRWTPTATMIRRDPANAEWAGGMEGGLDNPLGARALYLHRDGRDTLLPAARHQRADEHRKGRVLGVHPAVQPRHRRPLRARSCRGARAGQARTRGHRERDQLGFDCCLMVLSDKPETSRKAPAPARIRPRGSGAMQSARRCVDP